MSAPLPSPAVSVIVPNYNYAGYLRQRLDSIFAQTFEDYEVILLDDCSKDDSLELLRSYEGHPKVKALVANESNSGSPFLQWEKGLQMASGRYIWIAEADDLADPTFLEKTVAALDSDPEMGLCMTMSHIIDSQGDERTDKEMDRFAPDGTLEVYDGQKFVGARMFNGNSCYNASMVLFRRDFWRNVTARDYMGMRYCGDWLFWIYMMLQGHVGVLREKLNYFRIHGKSTTDEGRVNRQGYAECSLIQCFIVRRPGMLSLDDRIIFSYRYYRDRHRAEKDPEKYRYILNLSEDFWDRLGVNRLNFPLYWAYKHMFPRRKQRRIRPLSVTPVSGLLCHSSAGS